MNQKKQRFPRILGISITNSITALRFAGIYFLIASFMSGNLINTAILSGIIGSTDLLDGFCARNLNGKTSFGALFDAGTDKLFSATLLILLSSLNPLFLLNFLGEIEIGSVNLFSRIKHHHPETIFKGKVKSAILFISMTLSFALASTDLSYLLPLLIFGNFALQNNVCYHYYQIYKKEEKKQKKWDYERIDMQATKELSKRLAHQIQREYQPDLLLYIAKGGYCIAHEIQKEFHLPLIDIYPVKKEEELKEIILPLLPESLKQWLRKDGVYKRKDHLHFNKKISYNNIQWKLYKQRKHILVVDDMVETGVTIKHVSPIIQQYFKDAEIKFATLSNFEIPGIDFYLYENKILAGPWGMDSKDYKKYLQAYKMYLEEKDRKIKQLEHIMSQPLTHYSMQGSYKDSNKILQLSKIKTK